MQLPSLQVAPSWPDWPETWIQGASAGIATDKLGNVWILHRPASVTDKRACCKAAPAVMEFDPAGKLLQSWIGSAEDPTDTVRALMCLEYSWTQRGQETRPDVVAQGHGAQELDVADAELLTDRQSRGYHIAARMPAIGPRVIGFVGMSQAAIGKRRFYGTAKHLRSSYGSDLLASIRGSETDGRTPGWQFRAGDHRAERVPNVLLGFLDELSGRWLSLDSAI